MVAHGFIKVHAVEYGSIETGEELLRDDEDFGQFARFHKGFANLLLFVFGEAVIGDLRPVVVKGADDNLRLFGR
jgi:hypothetical protein